MSESNTVNIDAVREILRGFAASLAEVPSNYTLIDLLQASAQLHAGCLMAAVADGTPKELILLDSDRVVREVLDHFLRELGRDASSSDRTDL